MRVLFASLWLVACTSPNDAYSAADDAALPVGADAASSSGGGGGDAGLAPTSTDYGHDGPDGVSKTTLSVVGGLGGWSVDVYTPSSAGPHPVVLLSAGLQQPADAYARYALRLASWGVVTVLRGDPGAFGTSSSQLADDLTMLATQFLPAQNASGPLAGRLDLTRLGLAGHSRGGQASLLALEDGLRGKARGFFGLDPVDAKPMFGGGNAPQARTELGRIGLPTVFMGETTNGSGANACAPSADNYAVLYAAAPSPSVSLTVVGADHTQFEDPASCSFCNLCMPAGSADGAAVLALAVRYLTAFFARELLGDAAVGARFEGAGVAADLAAGAITRDAK